ncbi:AAA family ATPase [Pyrococcus abyssi]|uniref:Methanol dehydrogenase regulatory protein n=1 Tax=Pyrococcus abyssi (strain GE5 / Orsay) TaxID=272844 RepID=Q9UY76_PYRAB|nr:MoxR family ATPase [Pyrococcus abyssi]CAB50536.1 moxR-1 methanol dehydrogenase regulatory protein [Pyrococcus abyssi GE5]CCE71093.1 TPA: methanol dehydrogenase regulatory protein [Pyrococcus abyssi GE5]
MNERIEEVINSIGEVFIGKVEVVRKVFAAALVNGNVLFEDHPGLGKTLLAKAFAKVLGLNYRRIQFTPDLLPADIIGTKVWRPEKGVFEIMKGPIFTNVLLADEINRAPPKTQSALLEAMEERQVTIEGETFRLEQPFFVIATQNPLEFEGTYPLPEAQLDRFLVRLSVGYPGSEDEEMEILKARLRWGKDDPTVDLKPVLSKEEFLEMQRRVEHEVKVHDDILRYIVRIVRRIREDERVEAGPSPRGALALMKLSKANAFIEGRDFVIPDDVKAFVIDALSHRIVLKPEYSLERGLEREIVEEAVNEVPVPKDLEY